MNDTTRRGFLGLLAHVPLVGAWLAKRDEAPWYLHGPTIKEIESFPLINNGPFITLEYKVIRWVPVTERLPECNMSSADVQGQYSRRVLAIDATGHLCVVHHRQITSPETGRLLRGWIRDIDPIDQREGWMPEVAHWAELPALPAQICAKGDA